MEDSVREGPVRLGNRTYRTWRTAKLTLMVRLGTEPTIIAEGEVGNLASVEENGLRLEAGS